MKILKKMMILIIILIIIILGCLIYLKQNEDEDTIFGNESVSTEIKEVFKEANKIQLIEENKEYFNVKKCLNTYARYSNELLNKYDYDYDAEYLENIKKQLPSIIPDFVKEKLQLKEDNIYSKAAIPDKFIRIDSVYKSLQTISTEEYIDDTNICAYIVNGVFIDRNNYQKENFKIILVLDINNSTFFVIPEEYIKQENIDLENNINFEIYTEKEIEKNEYNNFVYSTETEEDMCEEYFNRYRLNLTYDSEYIYNNLNQGYREERFGDYQGFKNYIQKNEKELKNIKLTEYLVNYYTGYTEYVCKDQNERVYVFKEETSPMNFTLKLDTYTIPTDKFVREYNAGSDQKKVVMNIDKWIQMLNYRDYVAAYNLLDESFRTNNFSDVEKFENYIKNNLFDNNIVKINSMKDEGQLFVADVIISDANSDNTKKMDVIMKLDTQMNFVMSFNIK